LTKARLLVIVVVLGAAAALIISRVDVEQAIREVTLPLRHDDIIRQQAAEKNLDPALIAAVINQESSFDEHARSSAGARGLMQVTRDTADHIAQVSGGVTFTFDDLDDPQINISYGSFLLRELLDRYDGNLIAALAAYNAGIGNVDSWGGVDLTLDDIKFDDARAYVEQVLEYRDQYRDNYADDLGL
jgi:soluble lytic murein transglycosylase